CARALAAEGAGVLACSRRFREGGPHGEPLKLPALGEVTPAHLDVTDEAEVKRRLGELPELDILVCSAGVGTFGPVISASCADLREMLDVHVIGTLSCA